MLVGGGRGPKGDRLQQGQERATYPHKHGRTLYDSYGRGAGGGARPGSGWARGWAAGSRDVQGPGQGLARWRWRHAHVVAAPFGVEVQAMGAAVRPGCGRGRGAGCRGARVQPQTESCRGVSYRYRVGPREGGPQSDRRGAPLFHGGLRFPVQAVPGHLCLPLTILSAWCHALCTSVGFIAALGVRAAGGHGPTANAGALPEVFGSLPILVCPTPASSPVGPREREAVYGTPGYTGPSLP